MKFKSFLLDTPYYLQYINKTILKIGLEAKI